MQINKNKCGVKTQEYFNINLHKPSPWKCLCMCRLPAAPLPVSEQAAEPRLSMPPQPHQARRAPGGDGGAELPPSLPGPISFPLQCRSEGAAGVLLTALGHSGARARHCSAPAGTGEGSEPRGCQQPLGAGTAPAVCVTHHPLHALRAPAPCAITLGGAEMAWVLPAGGRRLSKRQSSGLLLLAVAF